MLVAMATGTGKWNLPAISYPIFAMTAVFAQSCREDIKKFRYHCLILFDRSGFIMSEAGTNVPDNARCPDQEVHSRGSYILHCQ